MSTDDSAAPVPPLRMNMGGIHTAVYNLPEALESPHPIAVLFASHGLMGHQFDLDKLIRGIIAGTARLEAEQASGEKKRMRKREIVVVSLDQRNHGERFVGHEANQYLPKNPRHSLDLYSLFRGTTSDISALIDVMPSYLFPRDEKEVVEFWSTGISLGGHVTYQLLTHDPRVTLGVPIIGCPDYTALTKSRLAANPSSPPPIFPQTLQQLLLRTDPINSPHSSDDPSRNPFWTKKLLVLTGADDDVVPSALGDKFYQGLILGPKGVKRRIMQDGVGHRCSREMIGRAAEFLWECGMSEEIEGDTETLGKSML